MAPDDFVKIFDVVDAGYRDWTFAAFGLIFVAVGTLQVFWPRLVRATGSPYIGSRFGAAFRYGFLAFGILWTALVAGSTYRDHLRHRDMVRQGRCATVEGPVADFIPMPYGGHPEESFSVSGVRFAYSDFGVTDAFNNSASHGGPVTADAYVRICYDLADRAILRLEIRGYRGLVKDYSTLPGLFSVFTGDDRFRPDVPGFPLPWSVQAAFYVAAAAFWFGLVGCWALFPSYLRTLLVLGTRKVEGRSIGRGTEERSRQRLRGCVVRWDEKYGVLWLRPRGYAMLQLPMIARLRLDEGPGAVVTVQSGVSWILPLSMILGIGVIDVQILTLISTGAADPGGWFVGLFTVMALVIMVTGWLRLRRRMDRLVDEAMAELAGG